MGWLDHAIQLGVRRGIDRAIEETVRLAIRKAVTEHGARSCAGANPSMIPNDYDCLLGQGVGDCSSAHRRSAEGECRAYRRRP